MRIPLELLATAERERGVGQGRAHLRVQRATGLKFHDNIVSNDTSSGGEEPIE